MKKQELTPKQGRIEIIAQVQRIADLCVECRNSVISCADGLAAVCDAVNQSTENVDALLDCNKAIESQLRNIRGQVNKLHTLKARQLALVTSFQE